MPAVPTKRYKAEIYGVFIVCWEAHTLISVHITFFSIVSLRISITFRRMDELKRPIGYAPEPDLQDIEPLSYQAEKPRRLNSPKSDRHVKRQPFRREDKKEAWGLTENNERSRSEPRYSNRTRTRRGSSNKIRITDSQ